MIGQSIASVVKSSVGIDGCSGMCTCGVFRFGGRHPSVFKDGPRENPMFEKTDERSYLGM